MENVETLTEAKATKIVTACAHCLNTLKNEYPQFGTELRGRAPHPAAQPPGPRGPADPGGPARGLGGRSHHHLPRPVLPRPPQRGLRPARELLGALPGATVAEMPRSRERSFCCGAGGARMWMEEKIGTRINLNRTEEALATLETAGGPNWCPRDRHGVPVLPGDAERRPHRQAGRRHCAGDHPGDRRRPVAAGVRTPRRVTPPLPPPVRPGTPVTSRSQSPAGWNLRRAACVARLWLTSQWHL